MAGVAQLAVCGDVERQPDRPRRPQFRDLEVLSVNNWSRRAFRHGKIKLPDIPSNRQPEVHLNVACNSHGLPVLCARLKTPSLDGPDCFLVKTEAKRSHNPNIPRFAILINLEVQNHRTLVARAASLVGVIGFKSP